MLNMYIELCSECKWNMSEGFTIQPQVQNFLGEILCLF